jgi:hypothetical protein
LGQIERTESDSTVHLIRRHQTKVAARRQKAEAYMNDDKRIKFLCIGMTEHGRGSYGTGMTFDEAASKYKELACDSRFMCWMWVGSLPSSVTVGPFGNIVWNDCTERPILIQDNRLKKIKDKSPATIGMELV